MLDNAQRCLLRLPRALLWLLVVLASLTSVCIATELFCKLVLRWQHPYTWPLTPVTEIGFDLNAFFPKFTYFHSRRFFSIEPEYAFAYPAPMALFYWLVYRVTWYRTEFFMLFVCLSFYIPAYLVYRTTVRRGLDRQAATLFFALPLVFSYPLWFEAKQGNLEIFVWILLTGGVYLFLRRQQYSAATCFAIAGSMKLFPFIFLGLHLAKGRWKPVLLAFAVAVLFTITSLWLISGDVLFSWKQVNAGIALFQQKIVLQLLLREIGYDHSLFSLVKRIWLAIGLPGSLKALLRVYMVTVAVAGTLLYFVRIRRLPVLNQVLCLTICAILLPPVSYDYTLIHLYLPLAMLVLVSVDARLTKQPTRLTLVMVLFAIAIAPLAEFIPFHTSIAGQLRAPVLLALLVVGLVQPFSSRFDVGIGPLRTYNKRSGGAH